MHFWKTLKKPILCIAPMADVTDVAFRRMFAKYGKPDVMWTEFVSCDGLYHTREKQGLPDKENPLMQDLLYDESERPIVAQLFTGSPQMMEYGARLVLELGFDGVDINMGCPDRAINKQYAGADLIRNPKLAQEIVYAAKQGAKSDDGGIPVSIKTRVGYNKVELESWVPTLLETKPAVLTIHARTRKELSKVPARWEHVKETVEIRDALKSDTLIFGNGDVSSIAEAYEKVAQTGCDGVMIGRGIFGNPWFFTWGLDPQVNAQVKPIKPEAGSKEYFEVMLEHVRLFEELLPHKPFHIMKKHFKAYIHGFDGAKELRAALMGCTNSIEVEALVKEFLR